MSPTEPDPHLSMNFAPDLPHFGKAFVYHGRAGILTFRIDMQDYTHDGLVRLGGIILHGTETFETEHVEDCTGEFLTVFVTESEYMRLSNARLG
jgi:hypothetical protein